MKDFDSATSEITKSLDEMLEKLLGQVLDFNCNKEPKLLIGTSVLRKTIGKKL